MVGNVWSAGGIGGANDHKIGPSGENQEEEQESTIGSMDFFP